MALGSLSLVVGCGHHANRVNAVDLPLERHLVAADTLGSVMGEATFREVRGMGMDSSGRIWVAERDAMLHAFSPSGAHVGSWNRKGGGPGEFQEITDFDVDPLRDRMLVRSRRSFAVLSMDFEELGHWQVLDVPSFTLLDGARLIHGRDRAVWPLAARTDSSAHGDRMLTWTSGRIVQSDLTGLVIDTVAPVVGGWFLAVMMEGAQSYFSTRAPGSGNPIWLPVDSTGLIEGNGHTEYRLAFVTWSGDTIASFRRDLDRVVLTDESGLVLHQGFVSGAVVDPTRRELLVCRAERMNAANQRVDYFRLDGEYLGTLEWRACPWMVSPEGVIYALERNEEDVPQIIAYRYAQD